MAFPLCERAWIIQQHEEFSPEFIACRWDIIEWKTGFQEDGFLDAHEMQERIYRSMSLPPELLKPSPAASYGESHIPRAYRMFLLLQMWRKKVGG